LLIEQLLPEFDATRIEHRVVPGEIESAYEATRQADFMRAWREIPAVRFLFAARSLAERAVSLVRGRSTPIVPEPETMRVADMPTRGEWVLLAENPPVEIAFGAIGRFWAGQTVWERVDAADFAAFDRPGLAKIACNFSLRPYGGNQTLVTYECRTRGTDLEARKGFLRYWRALSPFIGVVLRAQLRIIESEARRRPHPPNEVAILSKP
jgi:hypothetical protein